MRVSFAFPVINARDYLDERHLETDADWPNWVPLPIVGDEVIVRGIPLRIKQRIINALDPHEEAPVAYIGEPKMTADIENDYALALGKGWAPLEDNDGEAQAAPEASRAGGGGDQGGDHYAGRDR